MSLPETPPQDGRQTESHVYFAVFDFGNDPGVVTAIMGIEPTIAWVEGEHHDREHPKARRTHSRWSLMSGLQKAASLEHHLAALLAKLEPKRTEIRQVAARFRALIGVAQYFYEEFNPMFTLEAPMLDRLARLALPLDFDQYFLGGEESECADSAPGGTPDKPDA